MTTISLDHITYILHEQAKSATVLTCQSQATHIVIPEQIAHDGENYTMKRIGEYAFKNCPMQTISLPDTICTIEENAFCFCRKLQHVRIPALVKIIPAYCFSHCTHLTAVELTEQTKWISQNAFATCFGLQSINLQHVQVIQKMAFFNCKSLQSVVLSNELICVEDFAFAFCSQLTTCTMPVRYLERYGKSVFLCCDKLQTIFLPKFFQRYVEENLFPPLTEQQAYIQYM